MPPSDAVATLGLVSGPSASAAGLQPCRRLVAVQPETDATYRREKMRGLTVNEAREGRR
jgi:hypothetical protein